MTSIMRVRTTWASGVANGGGLMVQHWGGTPSTTTAQQAVDATQTALNLLTSAFTNQLGWIVSGTVDVINDANGDLVDQLGVTSRSGTGTGSGTTVPRVIQALVQLRTQTFVAGRRLTGRMFIPGLLEAQRNSDSASSVALAQMNACGASLAAANPGLLIWSRRHLTSAEVTVGTAVSKLAVLRSRRD